MKVIEKLHPPTSVKGVRSFLRHVDFYRRFIRDFSKIAKPLAQLLVKDVPFEFDEECLSTFHKLKEALITARNASSRLGAAFEIICNASDYAIGAVLG